MLQHLIIRRIQWPLLISQIPIFLAFKLEQKVSNHWKMATPPSLNIINFLFLFFGISLKCSKYYLRYISDHPKSINDTKLSNCRFRVSGKMDKLCSARLGPLMAMSANLRPEQRMCIRIHIFDSKKQAKTKIQKKQIEYLCKK